MLEEGAKFLANHIFIDIKKNCITCVCVFVILYVRCRYVDLHELVISCSIMFMHFLDLFGICTGIQTLWPAETLPFWQATCADAADSDGAPRV